MEANKGLNGIVSYLNEKLNYVRNGIDELKRLRGDVFMKHAAGSMLDKDDSSKRQGIIYFIVSGFILVTGIFLAVAMGIGYSSQKANTEADFRSGVIDFVEYDEQMESAKNTYLWGIILGISLAGLGLLMIVIILAFRHKEHHEAKVLSTSGLDSQRSTDMRRLSQNLYQTLMDVDEKILNLRSKYKGDLSIFVELENDSMDLKRQLNEVMQKKK